MKRGEIKRKTPLKRTPFKTSKNTSKTTTKKPPKGVGKKKVPSVATLDRMFSEYIRRLGFCELPLSASCTPQLHASHIKSRRFSCTRWLPSNAVAQCASCHRFAHNNPDLFIRAIEKKWPGRLEEIQEIWLRGDKPDRQAIYDWLKEELSKLK